MSDGYTALMAASEEGNASISELLLREGKANANQAKALKRARRDDPDRETKEKQTIYSVYTLEPCFLSLSLSLSLSHSLSLYLHLSIVSPTRISFVNSTLIHYFLKLTFLFGIDI